MTFMEHIHDPKGINPIDFKGGLQGFNIVLP